MLQFVVILVFEGTAVAREKHFCLLIQINCLILASRRIFICLLWRNRQQVHMQDWQRHACKILFPWAQLKCTVMPCQISQRFLLQLCCKIFQIPCYIFSALHSDSLSCMRSLSQINRMSMHLLDVLNNLSLLMLNLIMICFLREIYLWFLAVTTTQYASSFNLSEKRLWTTLRQGDGPTCATEMHCSSVLVWKQNLMTHLNVILKLTCSSFYEAN